MKGYKKLLIIYIVLYAVLAVGINYMVGQMDSNKPTKAHRVGINRVHNAIDLYEETMNAPVPSLSTLKGFSDSKFEFITGLQFHQGQALSSDIINVENCYELYETEYGLYRIDYEIKVDKGSNIILIANLILAICFVVTMGVLIYVEKRLVKPFAKMTDLPYELSKGNLTAAIDENKNKYFGKFIWGMNILRENIEDNKKKELELVKEKKVLLMSLSHDIKTPLSAIKLYSKALSKGLYDEEEKKQEIAQSIDEKVDEIEGFIAEIVKASNDDFIQFEVDNQEFYVRDVLDNIRDYYEEKMRLSKIEFDIASYRNVMVIGDKDRVVEVIQNLIENAIKYGDGMKIWIDTVVDDEGCYIFELRNTGCSLQKKELPHIFDSFFRGSNVGKKPGSGLGLYIARKLIMLMDGEITADIEEGNVMCIRVIVPMA